MVSGKVDKFAFPDNYFYYYRYSALGPVWAETRAQSGDCYVSGMLHPGQILRGSVSDNIDIKYKTIFANKCTVY